MYKLIQSDALGYFRVVGDLSPTQNVVLKDHLLQYCVSTLAPELEVGVTKVAAPHRAACLRWSRGTERGAGTRPHHHIVILPYRVENKPH